MRKVKIKDRKIMVRGISKREARAMKADGLDIAKIEVENIEAIREKVLSLVISKEDLEWLSGLKSQAEVIADDFVCRFETLSYSEVLALSANKEHKRLGSQERIDEIIELVLTDDQIEKLEDKEYQHTLAVSREATAIKEISDVFTAALKETFGSVGEEKN